MKNAKFKCLLSFVHLSLRVQVCLWLSQVVETSFVDWCQAALHLGEVCVVLRYTELFRTGTPILLHPQHHPHER